MAKILEYDGVVIGAGHNGMICAAYLAKCGQKMMAPMIAAAIPVISTAPAATSLASRISGWN